MKRFAAVISLLALLLLCACSGNGGADLKTYENTLGGYKFNIERDWDFCDISSFRADTYIAFQAPANREGVSQASVTVDFTDGDLSEFMNSSFDSLEGEKRLTDITLGGKPAQRIDYTIDHAGVKRSACCAWCVYEDRTYIVRFISAEDMRETFLPVYETALSTFEFTARTEPETTSEVDYSGGTLNSADGDFSFDYPSGWGVIRNDGMPAVAPEGAGATVSVTVFSLPPEKTAYGAYDYWKEYSSELDSVLGGITITKEYDKESEPKLGGVVAARKEYSAVIDGREIKYIQVICIRNGYVYSVLFASDTAEYGAYSPAFDGMLASFRFK